MQSADGTLRTIRRVLLAALIAGMAGTASELLLIGHFEDSWQLVPLVLLSAGTLVAVAHAVRPHALTVRLLQLLMGLFLVSGGIGMLLHYPATRSSSSRCTRRSPGSSWCGSR